MNSRNWFDWPLSHRELGRTAFVWIAVAVLIKTAFADQPAPGAYPLTSAPPAVLHFCAAHCATWYLTRDARGYRGEPDSPSPEPYGVKIVTFNDQEVVLDRTDAPNRWFHQGLKATIWGHVSPEGGSLRDGKINWTFGQGGTYDARVTWGQALDSIPGDDNFLPPVVMHFCAAHCATLYLTLDRKGYTGTPKTPAIGPEGYGLTIVRFDHDGVELDRVDPPNQWFANGLKAVITGQVSAKGNGLVNGKIHWTFGQGGTYDARLSWGTGLNDIPGQDGPALASSPQSQQLAEELMIFFLALPFFFDDDTPSSSSSHANIRANCAAVYSAVCGNDRRKNPR